MNKSFVSQMPGHFDVRRRTIPSVCRVMFLCRGKRKLKVIRFDIIRSLPQMKKAPDFIAELI